MVGIELQKSSVFQPDWNEIDYTGPRILIFIEVPFILFCLTYYEISAYTV